jgi:GNAT superfamily N-acetyltransferase
MSETIIKLERSHIPAGIRLKEAAAWNQTEQDWARLLEMEPDGCFGLLCDGEVVATTTAVCFGQKLAWIGMVLTDPAYRGRGFARRLMEHALEFLERRGVEWLKLDATDMGRPLYLKLGFEDEALVERWVAPASRLRECPPSSWTARSTWKLLGPGVQLYSNLWRLRRQLRSPGPATAWGAQGRRPPTSAHAFAAPRKRPGNCFNGS